MISSDIFRVATRTWPFLYFFQLSTSSAFSFRPAVSTIKAISSPSIRQISTFSHDNTQFRYRHLTNASPPFLTRHFSSSQDDDFIVNTEAATTTTSANFAMDPYSAEARSLTESLGISEEKHEKLSQLSQLVVEWNERLNLISRKDCNLEVVFGRHVLPSVALAALPEFKELSEISNPRIVDVGTGGGFPGLPLSIVFPEANFLLVDSVGKKLKAVDEMAAELELENIVTHHGRAEAIADDPIIGRTHRQKYDICVGRSVTAMPRFCFWIQDLLNRKEGKLVYIIGGEVEESVQSRVKSDVPIDELLGCEGASDKRTLILSSSDVVSVAKESGERKQVIGRRKNPKKKNPNKRRQSDDGDWKKSKGGWADRNNAEKKERGYSNFKRYEAN
jgi:16S rRNA (guanine527-N7)-methyltransferase